ncbi:MAG: anti-sigma factor domain-containing protein [Pirellula sp.]|jgi:hypothetical protein
MNAFDDLPDDEDAYSHDDSRVAELLAGKVLGDLSEDEQVELLGLGDSGAVSREVEDELEVTAASIAAVFTIKPQQTLEVALPAELHQKILRNAPEYLVRNRSDAPRSASTEQRLPAMLDRAGAFSPDMESKPKSIVSQANPQGKTISIARWRESFAWIVSIAASLFAAFTWQSLQNNEEPSLPGLLERRGALLATATDVQQVQWAPGKTPFNDPVSGDVVWSNESQNGFMRFVGMPINDSTREQYQLWIIDPGRDDVPIDGGVFDIDSTGEVIIPISAKLRVVSPVAFAITVEKPGGVVVSKQERLPLLAAIAKS